VEGQSKAKGIKRISDIKNVRRFFWGGMNQLFVGKMIFTILVSELKLR
jgi:hypothetical protein